MNFNSCQKACRRICFSLFGILFWTLVQAQYPLNFDFEKGSVEGMVRPWGWSVDSYGEFKVVMDSLQKRSGKYSLKISSEQQNTEEQILGMGIETFELENKRLEISGWIKTDQLEGSANFSLSYAPKGQQTDPEKHIAHSQKVSGSQDWQKLSLTMDLPDNVEPLYFKLVKIGKGTAWFDNFSLSVDGKKRDRLQIAPAFKKEQLSWLERSCHPISTVDVAEDQVIENPSNGDLEAFKNMVGPAQIIALGESTHGTSEFFRLKHRLLAYAIRELGVRVFAIEDNQLIVERVNQYVHGGPGTARASMYGMFGVWQNEEVHNMIQWVRNYNDQHPGDKVDFVGFDMQNLQLPLDSLSGFLQLRSTVLHQRVNLLLENLKREGARHWMASDSAKLSWFENAEECLDLLKEEEANWLANAKSQQDSSEIHRGIQYAKLVKQFAENAYKGHISLYRDKAMAENINWILDRKDPDTKMLIWAHDNHISRGEHPDEELNMYFGISMGAHLAKQYGLAYKAFGMSTYQGEYWAQVSYSNFRQLACPLFPGPVGSLDEALHQVGLQKNNPILLLDLRKARSLDWLSRAIPVRFANHVNIEYGYWTRFSIPYQFDGILFIDQTSAAQSYARK